MFKVSKNKKQQKKFAGNLMRYVSLLLMRSDLSCLHVGMTQPHHTYIMLVTHTVPQWQ